MTYTFVRIARDIVAQQNRMGGIAPTEWYVSEEDYENVKREFIEHHKRVNEWAERVGAIPLNPIGELKDLVLVGVPLRVGPETIVRRVLPDVPPSERGFGI